ncbi:M56 family metallopeptidase [Polymorphospora rubra]|uniref:M56 family metallopeptidase n=1 Tax=Polymorphospora rubra TaxID=338584 RepID=UPI0033C003AE
MFDHWVMAVVVGPFAGMVVVRLLAERLRPGDAAVVFAWSAVMLAASSTVSLFVFALKAAAELPSVAARGNWSHERVLLDTAHVPWASWLSLVLLVAVLLSLGRTRRSQRRAVRAARRQAAALPDHGPGDVVLLPDSTADAFTLPGPDGRIVVTTGMRDALTDGQYTALIAHERAHLTGRHHQLVMLAWLAAATHPLLRPMARHVEYLVERWADERAAEQTGDRRVVAQALGVAALATNRRGGLAHAGALHVSVTTRPGAVPRRMAAMLRPANPVRHSYLLYVPAIVAVASAVWAGEGVYDLHELLGLARTH